MVIIEIVVEAKFLLAVEPVIELDRKLVAALGLHRYSLNKVGACRRNRNKLKEIHGGGIQAFQGNLVVGKNGRVCDGNARRNRCPTNSGYGCLASWTLARPVTVFKRPCVVQRPTKWGFPGKIGDNVTIHHVGGVVVRTFRYGRNRYSWRGDPLTNASSFVGRKKERLIFLYRPAECPSELVLIEFRLVAHNPLYCRETVRIGVQNRVPEELVHVSVKTVGARLGDHVDDRTGIAAVFGVEGVGQNAEFLDTVR